MTSDRRWRERDDLVDRVTAVLRAEPSVEAAWLFGSLGRGDADALSDIDLAVVVSDDRLPGIAGAGFASRIADPLLVMETPRHAPLGGAFVTTFFRGVAGPQAIDWLWVPRSIARRSARTRVLIDRYGVQGGDDMPQDGSVPELSELEVATQAACSFWSMILWGAKLTARSPGEGEPPLLSHAVASLHQVEAFLGRCGTADASSFATLVDKMDALTTELLAGGITMAPDLSHQVRLFLASARP